MKKLLFILLVMPCFLQAQYLPETVVTRSGGSVISRYNIVYTYDTTIIFKGIDTVHDHVFVIGTDEDPGKEWICIICLRDFTVKITQTRVDRFLDAKRRLAKIKQ